MPYDIKGYNRGNRVGTLPDGTVLYKHHYSTPDTNANLIAAGYFNDLAVRGLVRKNECIEAMTVTGGTPLWRMYVITAVANSGTPTGTVTIAAVTGASLT